MAAVDERAAAMSARLVSLRAQLVWLACVALGVAVIGSADVTAVIAALVVTALLAAHLTAGAPLLAPRGSQNTALRERSRRTGVLRQCDPDAAGRPRPRAPSA